MATTIIDNTINVKSNDGDNGYYFRMEVIMNYYDSANNYWNVTVNHYAYGFNKQHYSQYSSPNSLIKTTIDGTTTTQQITQVSYINLDTYRKIGTWTGNIYANADGNKNVTFIAKYAPNNSTSYLPKTNTNSVNINMPTIPRYASITSFNVNRVDETTVNITWGANATCDWVWYSTDNGGSWHNGGGTNFNVGGLSAGTSYNFKIRVRRQDSQLTTDSGTYTQSTYGYPSINSAPNFVIGNGIDLGLYNPLGRSCDVYLINPANTEKFVGTTTSTSIPVETTQEWLTFFYNGIPNAQSGTYKVRLVCSAVSRDTTVNGGTYSVNADINKPDISNVATSYAADLTALTNNNQTVINNASTITYTISTGATAQNGASITNYTVVWGNVSDVITDIQNPATLVKGNGDIITVTVKDSRGITNSFTTAISEVVTYTSPTNLSTSPDRLNGVSEDVYLDVGGTIYYDKFGTNGVSNRITNIKYSIANETAQDVSLSLSSIAYSQQSLDTHTQKFSLVGARIYKDGVSTGFDTTKTYNVTVVVTDTSGNYATISGIIKDGKFAMIKGKDSNGDYHTGINGLPNDNYALYVHGDIYADNLSGGGGLDAYPIGSIYISRNSTSPATLFGGTWSQITDRFLLACGSTYAAGSTGGAASVTLTANQSGLRAHNHGIDGNGTHSHQLGMNDKTVQKGSSYARPRGRDDTGDRGYTSTDAGWHGHGCQNAGPWDAAEAHNNMPPYLAVYAWERIPDPA